MKIKKLFALILALATLCTAGGVHVAATEETSTNLVQNPTFSNGMEGWTYSAEGDPLASVGGFAEGEKYVKPAAGSHIEQLVPITETGTYRLSFKMKATVYNAATLEKAVYMADGHNYTEQFSNDPSKENYDTYRYGMGMTQDYIGGLAFGETCAEEEAAWKEYALTVPVPSKNVTRFRIRLYFNGTTAPLGVDDIRFEKVNDSAAAVVNGGMDYLSASNNASLGGYANQQNVSRETEPDGNHYMKLTSGGQFRQFMAIDGGKTYRLSYRMKSATANPMKFYNIDKYFFYKDGYSEASRVTTGLTDIDFDTTYEGDALNTWKSYNLTFSAPEEANVFLLFVVAYAECFLDDIAIEEVNTPFNYIFNGDFEGGTAGWKLIGSGTIAQEADGNRYYARAATKASAAENYFRQYRDLPAGRYKLSFKAKVQTKGATVGIAFEGRTVGWNDDFQHFKKAPCNAIFTDDWQTFNFYFTMPTDSTDFYLKLAGGYWADGAQNAWYDDVTLTKDTETRLEFAEYTQHNVSNGFAEAKNTETLTALRNAGATIPVAAHYIPQSAGDDEKAGIAETVYLMAALYETVGDAKKLVGIDIQKGITDVSDAAQKGRTAKGIVSLQASLDTPGDLSDKHEVKAFLINNDNLLSPAYKTMTLGY